MEPRRLLSVSAAVRDAIAAVPTTLRSEDFVQLSAAAHPTAAIFVGRASPNPGTITVTELRGAYGITGNGAGQTIAIVDAYDDPGAAADLNTFDAAYGLPAPASFTKVTQFGTPVTATVPGDTSIDGTNPVADSVETSLDIEWAHAIAPSAAIVLVETNSLFSTDLYQGIATAATLPGVSVVSMSFGSTEFPGETSTDTIFTTPVGHQGVTFVAASGDTGAFAPDSTPPIISAVYPAASPNVVAVGGTNLTVNGTTYGGETGWGNGTRSSLPADAQGDPLGGSGGGISAYETAPAYQTFITGNLGNGNRVYPDVALEGGPDRGVSVVDSYATGSTASPWLDGAVYGTSLAAPLFAGVVADADAGRVAAGLSTLDGATQTLPRLYELPGNAFHDVTVGNNGFQAGPGYDLVTGRGSPVGANLVPDLASTYIGYHAFADINVDGVQQPGERGVAGVAVLLETPAGVVVQATTTDASGLYQFLNPAPGSYVVHFTAPAGFRFSPVGTATNPILDSTVDPATGNVAVTITAGSDAAGAHDDPFVNCGLFTETVSITDATIQRPQAGTAPLTFTVTITPASTTATFSVPYTTVGGTPTSVTDPDGPATVAHNDYLATSGVLVFAPGVTTETVVVQIVGNALIERDLQFAVVLSPPAAAFDLVDSKTRGTGTIVNTSFPAVTTTAVPTDTAVRSATAPLTFTFPVTLTAPAPFTTTVSYTTADNTAVGGIDYVRTTGTLTFGVDPTTGLTAALTQDVTVSVLPGTNRQLDKTFFLRVTGDVKVTTGTPAQATGTIQTNAPPAVNALGGEVTESLTGTALLPFQIQVAPSLTGPVTLTYATSDGTAVAGVDYAATSGTVTLAPGRIQQTIYVPVFRRFLAAQDRTVNFTISNPSVPITLLTPTVTGTIHDLALSAVTFGTGNGGRARATYTDNLNHRVTVGLTGPGTGQVVFLGTNPVATNAFELILNGTTGDSNLSVSVSGGGQTTLNNILVNGAIGNVTARSVNLQGDLTVNQTAANLTLGYLNGSTVTLGGSPANGPVSINVRRAVDTMITSAVPIRSLVAGAYIDTTPGVPDYVTAPSVGTVRVAGNMGATIRTTGSVQALVVRGTLSGGVLARDGIGTVTAGTFAGATLMAGTDGSAALPTAAAAFTNTAGSIGRVSVRTGFSDSVIAGWTVGPVTLGSVQTAAGGAAFGIAANRIVSVHATAGSTGQVVSVIDPKTQVSVDNFRVSPI